MTHASAGPDPAIQTEPGSRALDRSLVTGIAWTGAVKWSGQILSWLATLVVARILVPADFGLVGMATVYLGLIQVINQFGLGAAILQKRDLEQQEIARLGGFSALLAVCLLGASLLAAGPVAEFFNEPTVGPVIRVLSITFLTGAFEVVPRTLLTRDLEFRRLAVVDACSAVTATLTTVGLALVGVGYWALVIGTVVGRLTSTAAVLWFRPHPVAWPWEFQRLRGALSFGAHVVFANVAFYAFRNADLAIVGRVLGKMALGIYDLGITIASTPIDRLNELTSRVAPAVFAAVQHDSSLLRRYFLGLTEGTALISFPAAAGLALVANDFVLLAVGPKWEGAIVPLRILALAAAFRSIGPLLALVLIYSGHPARNTQYTLLAAVVLPPLFFVASRWGVAGVAAVWLIAQPVVSIATAYRHAFRVMDLSWTAYLRALWPAISAAAAMTLVVAVIQTGLAHRLPLVPRFAIEVVSGVASYTAALYLGHRARVQAFWSLLPRIRGSAGLVVER